MTDDRETKPAPPPAAPQPAALPQPILDYRAPAQRLPWRVLLRRLGPAGVLTALAACLPVLGTAVILSTVLALAPWLRSHGAMGVLIYVAGFWIFGGLAIVPTWVQSGLGGWTFGFATGLPAALLSYGGASLVGYAIAHRASGDRVTQLIAENPRWQAVYDALLSSGFWRTLAIVTLIRVPPNSPFAVTNVVMAATRVPMVPFLLGTVLGIAPRTAAVIYTFSRMKSLDFNSPHEAAFFLVGLATMALAVLLIVALARHALAHVTGSRN